MDWRVSINVLNLIPIFQQMPKLLPITKKQQSIILLLHRFRFLNRVHIQKLLNHKDPKTINEWLKDLTEKGYIKRLYEKTFPNNTKPAIYHIDKNGVRFLKSQLDEDENTLHKLYWEEKRTDAFIDRCLLLADIYLDLAAKTDGKTQFAMYLSSDYTSLPEKDSLKSLQPQAYVNQKQGKQTKQYFIEIVPNTTLDRIRQKARRFISFYSSNEWEGETNSSFPIVLFVCPNYQIQSYLKKYLKRTLCNLEEPDLELFLTTAEKVKAAGIMADIWDGA